MTALTLRAVFHLAPRQTEGFVGSPVDVLGPPLHTPDHSTCPWRKESGAHRQARAGSGMCRYTHTIADRLRAKHGEPQKREALVAVNARNRMTALGMPASVKAVV